MAVDPVGHRGVVLIRNEHGKREPVQQPFGRALPVRLSRAHRDKLPGERQCVLGQPQLTAHPGPQVQLALGNVVRVLAQAD